MMRVPVVAVKSRILLFASAILLVASPLAAQSIRADSTWPLTFPLIFQISWYGHDHFEKWEVVNGMEKETGKYDGPGSRYDSVNLSLSDPLLRVSYSGDSMAIHRDSGATFAFDDAIDVLMIFDTVNRAISYFKYSHNIQMYSDVHFWEVQLKSMNYTNNKIFATDTILENHFLGGGYHERYQATTTDLTDDLTSIDALVLAGTFSLTKLVTEKSNVIASRSDIRALNRVGLFSDHGMIPVDFQIRAVGKCDILLLDPLGRPIRTWSMEIAAGESHEYLNVADIPSGVYFLRFSAPGVDDMKKVCIVH